MTAPADRPPLRDRCDQICDRVSVSSVVRRYRIELKRAGSEWQACCPFHDDRSPSFSIYAGDRRWICFAGCGEGNVLDFIMKYARIGLIEAIEVLGDGSLPAAAPAVRRPAETRTEEQNSQIAGRTWKAGQRIGGTLGERYIVDYRKLSLDGIARDDLRFHPECVCGKGAERWVGPALMVLFRDMLTREPIAIQRIRLDAAGRRAVGPDGKKLEKLSLGPTTNAAMMISGPWRDTAYIGIAEGPETAIALTNAGEGCVWAMGGAPNIRRFPLLFDRYPVSLVVFADADQPGQDAARVAAARYADAGRDALIISPTLDGDDFADLAA